MHTPKRFHGLRLRSLAVIAIAFSLTAIVRAQVLSPKTDSSDYKIAPRDQLQFQVIEEVESTLLQRVSSAGEIAVPLLGAVKVAGLTLREAEAIMEKRYREEGYYLRPQVILSFQAYAPRTVAVLGQVTNPNQIDFSIERGSIGLVTAITRAGGFTRVARTDAVRVIRTVNGKETSFTINVASYLEDRSKEQEFRLLPEDIVFVPERVF
jgi:polysaccharide export outer membrane protein